MTFNLRELDILIECLQNNIDQKRALHSFFTFRGKNKMAEELLDQNVELCELLRRIRQQLIAQAFSETLPKA